MTQYQLDIIFALRNRHDKGKPKPPFSPHQVVRSMNGTAQVTRALNALVEQGQVEKIDRTHPLYQLTAKGFTFTN